MGSKASFRLILSLSVLCAALSLAQRSQVEHALSLVTPASPTGIPQFAFEDFDGDSRPDLAEVQVEHTDAQVTQYSIRFYLTSGNNQSVGIAAPFGGLQIVARDVNGDNAPDLIVSTAFQHEPVAVLLNDGHGNFSRAEPSSFPGAPREAGTNWKSVSDRDIDGVGIPPQSCSGLSLQADALPYFRRRAGPIPVSSPGFLLTSFLISHAGRAPPSEASNS